MDSKSEPTSRSMTRPRPSGGTSARWFLVFLIVIIALGATAAYLYSNHLKQQMITAIKADTERQIATLQSDYETRLTTMSKEMEQLQSKVDSFNELLTFTKDNRIIVTSCIPSLMKYKSNSIRYKRKWSCSNEQRY